jgi:hypothetical protein
MYRHDNGRRIEDPPPVSFHRFAELVDGRQVVLLTRTPISEMELDGRPPEMKNAPHRHGAVWAGEPGRT